MTRVLFSYVCRRDQSFRSKPALTKTSPFRMTTGNTRVVPRSAPSSASPHLPSLTRMSWKRSVLADRDSRSTRRTITAAKKILPNRSSSYALPTQHNSSARTEDVFQKNGSVTARTIVWMSPTKSTRMETSASTRPSAPRTRSSAATRRSAFQPNTAAMVTTTAGTIPMKTCSTARTARSRFAQRRSSSVTTTDASLNNGSVTVTMTVEMDPMKNWRSVAMPRVLLTNSRVPTEDVFRFTGFAMEIMIVTMELMKTKRDVHQFNARLFSSDVPTEDSVSH